MRVLVADDDDTTRDIVTAVLNQEGYESIVAIDGAEANQILQQPDAPQIVILDWLMPHMDGPEVIQQARARPTNNPPYILMLTGKATEADLAAGLAAGANDYLVKPFKVGELRTRLAAARRMVQLQADLNVQLEAQRFQSRFHQLAAVASAALAAVSNEATFGTAVNTILQQLGELFAADRSYLFRFTPDLTRMSVTHEWTAPGIASLQHIQDWDITDMAWVQEQILAQKPLHIADVTNLPPEARAEKEMFLVQDVRSLLCLPTIGASGQLTGFIGFDMVNRTYAWSPEQIAMLQPVVGAVGSTLERLQAEAARQESRQRYHALFEQSHDAVFILDLDGRHLEVNQRGAEMFGYTPQEIATLSASDLSAEPMASQNTLQRLLAGEHVPTYERQFYAKDGRLLTVELSVEVVRDANGRPLHIQSVAHDVTERKRTEARIAQHQKELNEINRIGAMANTTLDLDTVLNLILENVTALMDAAVGMIFLKEPGANQLTWGASLGLSPDFVADYQQTPIQMGEGLTGTIAQTGQPIFIAEDASYDSRIARAVIHEEGLNSFIGVPILAGEAVVGVMNILTRPPALLTKEAVDICSAIGSQVGLAISNARLYADQQQAKADLSASEARLRSYIEHAPYGLFVADENGRYLEVNPDACAITGYDEAELLAMQITELHIAEESAAALSHFEQVKRTGFAVGDFTFRHKSGTNRYWRVSAIKLAPDRVMAFKEDITERKLAEREMRKYKTVLDNALHGAAIACLEGTLLYVNDYFAQVHGYTPEELLGQPIAILHNERQMAAVQATLQQMTTAGYYATTEVWHIRRDGSEFPMLMSGVLLKGEEDDVDYFATTAVDISDRKEAEEKLRQSHAELAAALQALQETQEQLVQQERLAAVGQLAAGIAHDFNNILAVILLHAQLVRRSTQLPDWEVEAIATIEKQTKTAAHLVQQILDFSRRAMLEKSDLDWLPLLKEQAKLLTHTLPDNIVVTLTALAPGPYLVRADATRLQQLVLNLAVNARDAMPNGGQLHLELDKLTLTESEGELAAGHWLRLRVHDTGAGVAEADRPYILEPFFTTKEPGQGSGLGLAQAQGIVLQHGGHITFETAVNQGTTFTIYMPALMDTAESVPPKPSLPMQTGGQEMILLVEDNEAVRQALIASLEVLNYRVTAVTNGQAAIDFLQANPDQVNLILSDMIMPGIGGAELFYQVQQQPKPIPMVIITGHRLNRKLEELVAHGLAGWLPKPPSLYDLADLLAKVLRGGNHSPPIYF